MDVLRDLRPEVLENLSDLEKLVNMLSGGIAAENKLLNCGRAIRP
jgi:hypothetical protein